MICECGHDRERDHDAVGCLECIRPISSDNNATRYRCLKPGLVKL